jgi:hypothetical protein
MPYQLGTWHQLTNSTSVTMLGTTWMITAGSIASGSIWTPWQFGTGTAAYHLPGGWQWGWSQPYALPQYQPETAAQRAAREERQAEDRRRAPGRRQALALVTARAEKLLLSLLDEAQAASYLRDGWFEVRGSAGGLFRIGRRGQAGNIDELPPGGGPRIASWCAHPSGGFPDADAHAAQYLALVTDEPGFRAVANRTPRHRIAVAA